MMRVVTVVLFNRLNPSASTSKFIFSLMWKRRERRASKYQILGCLKKLRGASAKRDEPPEPLTPPPGVLLEAKPKEVGLTEPEMFPVWRAPEKALRIGANVQPL